MIYSTRVGLIAIGSIELNGGIELKLTISNETPKEIDWLNSIQFNWMIENLKLIDFAGIELKFDDWGLPKGHEFGRNCDYWIIDTKWRTNVAKMTLVGFKMTENDGKMSLKWHWTTWKLPISIVWLNMTPKWRENVTKMTLDDLKLANWLSCWLISLELN